MPFIEPNEGKVYTIVNIECYKSLSKNFHTSPTSFSQNNIIDSNELSPLLPLPISSTPLISTIASNKIPNLMQNNLLNVLQQSNGFEKSIMPDCVDGSKVKIQLIDGISLIEQSRFTALQTETMAACLQICKMNAVKKLFIY